MYSETDFEKLWFLYKTEGQCKGISINVFCSMHGVSYKPFYDWLGERQKSIVPVHVDGLPSCVDVESSDVPASSSDSIHEEGVSQVSSSRRVVLRSVFAPLMVFISVRAI